MIHIRQTYNIFSSHLPHMTVNHDMNAQVTLCHFSMEELHKFQLSHTPVTLSEGQSYSHWN